MNRALASAATPTAANAPKAAAAIKSAAPPPAPSVVPRRAALAAAVLATIAAPGLVAPRPALALNAGERNLHIDADKLPPREAQQQRDNWLKAVTAVLKERLDASDAEGIARLVLLDAAAYDRAAGTGGFDGKSVAQKLPPCCADLASIQKKLRDIKATIDADQAARGGISEADLLTLAVRQAARKSWEAERLVRAGGDQARADQLRSMAGNSYDVRIGRANFAGDRSAVVDAEVPSPGASGAEVAAFLKRLGGQDKWAGAAGFQIWSAVAGVAGEEALSTESKLWANEAKANRQARETSGRTHVEVGYAAAMDRITSKELGATFDPTKYLLPVDTVVKIQL